MHKIKGLTENEVTEIITRVALNHKNKSFDCYSCDDIQQEVWIIALQKLEEFIPEKGKQEDLKKNLEHWLNTVVSNRLANLYRDKHVVPNKEHSKRSQTLFNHEIDVNLLENKCDYSEQLFNKIVYNDEWIYILNHLNIIYCEILESILNGEDVSSYYKIKLINKIKSVIKEYGEQKTVEK